jgi:hypothetical protein
MNIPMLPGIDDRGAEPKARLNDAETSVQFMLAGDAHVTFVSQRTGTRYTYRVAAPRDPSAGVRFVSVLTSPDTYSYIGTIFVQQNRFAWTKKSAISADAPSVKAFAWVWGHLSTGQMPPELEVWHEGRCGKCGRRLTDPASIASGLGPICAGRQ